MEYVAWSPGAVLGVEGSKICLWISGITEYTGIWIEPPVNFPNVLCYDGASFDVQLEALEDLVLAPFRIQRLDRVNYDFNESPPSAASLERYRQENEAAPLPGHTTRP